MSKPKVGFYWCASCGGCEESVVDLAEAILDVAAAVDFVFFPVAMDFKRSDVEAMADGAMAACMINGAIRSSEQRAMAKLLRRKAQILIAYGACSHQGGIPGLANLFDRQSILQTVYRDTPSTVNPGDIRPEAGTRIPHGEVELPVLDEQVKSLDQVVPVDYYIPGCAPPVQLLKDALAAILTGRLPPKGSVLAPDKALCEQCPRAPSKPDNLLIDQFKRPHLERIDPEKCLLAQGFLCLGPATRGGCGWACINANMPCTGCLGPVSRTRDYGGAAMSALASLANSNDEAQIAAMLETIVDPAGTFYRYGLPASLLFARAGANADKGGHEP